MLILVVGLTNVTSCVFICLTWLQNTYFTRGARTYVPMTYNSNWFAVKQGWFEVDISFSSFNVVIIYTFIR